jgi:hypothetical protein
MKSVLLILLLATSICVHADINMSGPSVGPSGIGIGKADDGSFKFVDTKTNRVLGDLNLGEISNVDVHASWNKSGTRVATLINYGTRLSMLRIYEVRKDGTIDEIKFDEPDPAAAYQAKTNKKFSFADNAGHDASDIGMWTDDNTAWFLGGVTKEIPAGDGGGAGRTVSLFVTFSVQVQNGKGQVAIESVVGPIHDNENADKATAFLQDWEHRNAISDSALQ